MAIKRLGVAKSSVFLAMMCVATALIAEIIGREHLTNPSVDRKFSLPF